MKKPNLGDTYTAPEAGSNVLITYIGEHPVIGQMIDVGLTDESSDSSDTHFKHLFYIGFPVFAAVKDGYLSFRGKVNLNISAPNLTLRYPNFKIGTQDIASWTIVHPDKREIVKAIDDDQESYPLAYIVNIELLNSLINNKWNGKTVVVA